MTTTNTATKKTEKKPPPPSDDTRKDRGLQPSQVKTKGQSPVMVEVVRQPIHEGGEFRAAGTTFETTRSRRNALGELVKEVKPTATKKE